MTFNELYEEYITVGNENATLKDENKVLQRKIDELENLLKEKKAA